MIEIVNDDRLAQFDRTFSILQSLGEILVMITTNEEQKPGYDVLIDLGNVIHMVAGKGLELVNEEHEERLASAEN